MRYGLGVASAKAYSAWVTSAAAAPPTVIVSHSRRVIMAFSCQFPASAHDILQYNVSHAVVPSSWSFEFGVSSFELRSSTGTAETISKLEARCSMLDLYLADPHAARAPLYVTALGRRGRCRAGGARFSRAHRLDRQRARRAARRR